MDTPSIHESTPVFTKKTKWLNKKISRISKFLLLFSFLIGGLHAEELVSSDRFLLRILDRTISFQDVNYQYRNLSALYCVYSDAYVVQYFEKSFIKDLESFVKKFPKSNDEAKRYLHEHEELMKKIRFFFKMLRYSEDQDKKVSDSLSKIIRSGTRENRCQTSILYKDTLKTNFKTLLEMELYLRSRYEGQLKSSKKGFESIRPSIDMFVESLDKQFGHEYYW